MRAGSVDWTLVRWEYSNRSLSRLLGVDVTTVCRMRSLYSPATAKGPGPRPPGRDRSGEHAPAKHGELAVMCRTLLCELATCGPTKETVGYAHQLLTAIALEQGGEQAQ